MQMANNYMGNTFKGAHYLYFLSVCECIHTGPHTLTHPHIHVGSRVKGYTVERLGFMAL